MVSFSDAVFALCLTIFVFYDKDGTFEFVPQTDGHSNTQSLCFTLPALLSILEKKSEAAPCLSDVDVKTIQ